MNQPATQPIHQTQSVCSTCLLPLEAKIIENEQGIWLHKTCPTHGEEIVLESKTKDFYHIAKPATVSAAKSIRRSLQVLNPEPLGPSCVALIEITDSCNLECPLCFANSKPAHAYFMSLSEFQARISLLIDRKGPLDIVMLSGGEPTIHPELPAMLEWLFQNNAVKHILLNTNGVRLAKDQNLRDALLSVYNKLELYLQFDSLQESTVEALRGNPNILSAKAETLFWLEQHMIATTFAVTLAPSCTHEELKGLINFGLSVKCLRGITFQPAFASGRHTPHFDPNARLTTPEVVERICAAAPDLFTRESFANLPCSHPNCAIVSYYLKLGKKLWPISTQGEVNESLKNRLRFTIEDLALCGCDTTELGKFITATELSPEHSFRIIVKPFMDRFNLNRDRTAQCCTHVVGPSGKVMSFCEYNVFRQNLEWNTNAH